MADNDTVMFFTQFINLCITTLLAVAQLLSFIPQVVHCHNVNCTESKVQVDCGATSEATTSSKRSSGCSVKKRASCCDCGSSSFARHRETKAGNSKGSKSISQQLVSKDNDHHHHLRMQEALVGTMVLEDCSSNDLVPIPFDLICFTYRIKPEVGSISQTMQIVSVNPSLMVLPLRI